jgi:hypothetical protein
VLSTCFYTINSQGWAFNLKTLDENV